MKVEAQDVKVWINAEAMQKMELWTDMAQGEISGLGMVEETQGGYLVSDVFLPYQKCGASDTDLTPEGVAGLMIELESLGLAPSQLKFWWHSHVNMKVFWSGKDRDTINGFAPHDYFISAVINKAGELLTRIDFYHPLRLAFQEVDTEIMLPDFGVEEECQELFRERVIEKEKAVEVVFTDFDLSYEEITNKVSTGELDWREAEEMLSGPGEFEWQRRLWDEY